MSATSAAAASSGASASSAAASTSTSTSAATATDAGLVIDFAALLLGAVFPADAGATTADTLATDQPDERDAGDEDASTNSVDLLFSLLAPTTPPPTPMQPHLAATLAHQLLPGETDGDASATATNALTAALGGQRDGASLLPQLAMPAPHTPTALPHTTALAAAAQAAAPAPDAAAAFAALQLAYAAKSAPDTAADPLAGNAGTGLSALAGTTAVGEAPAAPTAFASLLQATAPTPPARIDTPTVAPTTAPDPALAVRAEPTALADAAAAKLSWQADNNIGRAELRISPQDLGTVDIELRIEDRKLHIDFTSPHAEVRDALEAGLPRLREQLATHGLTLAQADIGGQPRGDRPPGSGEGTRTTRDAADATQDMQRSTTVDVRHRKGLLDEYA